MLYELDVENFALIRRMRLPLSDGLNALTGETGAGKSLVIDALSLLIGGRGNDSFIREGAERAMIEGVFLPPFPPAAMPWLSDSQEGDPLLLRRELLRGGRSLARINGRPATLAQLRELGRLLVNIHGQREHTLLLEDEQQLRLLDSFGGDACQTARTETGRAFLAWRSAQQLVREYQQQQDGCRQRMAELKEQVAEIDQAAPQPGEDQRLEEEARVLAHGESLYQLAEEAHRALAASAGGVERLNQAAAMISQAAELDKSLTSTAERLNSLYYESDDVASELAAYRDRVNIDAYRLDEIQARIAQLRRLSKKYGGSLETLLAFRQQASAEHDRLEELDISGDSLFRALEQRQREYEAQAAALSTARRQAADQLGQAVTAELRLLSMPKAIFRVDLPACDPGELGCEQVVFMIRPNVGESFQPVSRIASGGELSRIVLGLKVILAQLDEVPTLVFDEIDTGMSGRALVSVAGRLAQVGRSAQAIVVSHAAVMAAAAGHQVQLEKREDEGRTVIQARSLTEEERPAELARMIAGDKAGATTLRQAEEMLAQMRQ